MYDVRYTAIERFSQKANKLLHEIIQLYNYITSWKQEITTFNT